MKVLTGHLTATEKNVIKEMFKRGISTGKSGRKEYFIEALGNCFKVSIKQKDRGLFDCGGSPLRESIYHHTFTL